MNVPATRDQMIEVAKTLVSLTYALKLMALDHQTDEIKKDVKDELEKVTKHIDALIETIAKGAS